MGFFLKKKSSILPSFLPSFSNKDHIEKNNRFPEIKFDFEFPGWGNGAGCTAQVDLDQHGDLETTSDE